MKNRKYLVFDIETAPNTAYVWGLHEQYVSKDQIIENGYILSWAAKWAGSSKILYMDSSAHGPAKLKNDKAIVEGLVALINDADAVITFNGRSFDMKIVRARAIAHGLPPVKPVSNIDLYVASNQFKLPSRSLQSVAQYLNCSEQKSSHKKFPGMSLWVECLAGNKDAFAELKKYNIQDVVVTEEVYNKMAPWLPSGMVPVATNVHGKCSHCGKDRWLKRGVRQTASGTVYQSLQCKPCGKYKQVVIPKEKK